MTTRLTKQIIEFYENRSMAKIETIKWIAATKEDLKSFHQTNCYLLKKKYINVGNTYQVKKLVLAPPPC